MNKIAPIALLATLATFAVVPAAVNASETSQTVRATTEATAANVNAVAGQMIYGSNGQRVAAVYRVTASGAVQVILDGKLVTVPSDTLSDVNGRLSTSLTRTQLRNRR